MALSADDPQPEPGPAEGSGWFARQVRRFWWVPLAIGAVLVTILVSDDESTGALEVGDCTDRPAVDLEFFEAEEVSCADRHALEVFAFVDAEPGDDDRYPGHAEASSAYERLCLAEFEGYLGIPPDSSEFGVYTVYPSKGAWDDGYSLGTCLLGRFTANGALLTSVGSARDGGA